MELAGYAAVGVTPWEAASGEGAVECRAGTCTAGFTLSGATGSHDLVVAYYDVNTGTARYRVRAAGKVVGEWTAADRLPTQKLDGSETAALDYVEVTPTNASGAQRSLNNASATPRTPTAPAR